VTLAFARPSSIEGEFESSGPPVVLVNERGQGPFVLLCEHASRLLPAGYARLGLPAAEFDRHIAWDIGAAEVATRVACLLDAPLFLAGYSRLLIDLKIRPVTKTMTHGA
jgi:predicted N-formylglutamate amidohydrolase